MSVPPSQNVTFPQAGRASAGPGPVTCQAETLRPSCCDPSSIKPELPGLEVKPAPPQKEGGSARL